MRNSIIASNGAMANCQSVPAFERFGQNLSDDSSCGDSTVMSVAPSKLDSLRDDGTGGGTLEGPSLGTGLGPSLATAV